MKLKELLENIKKNNVPEYWYSINDGIKPDACIVLEGNGEWECFYMDEKGERTHDTFFTTRSGL